MWGPTAAGSNDRWRVRTLTAPLLLLGALALVMSACGSKSTVTVTASASTPSGSTSTSASSSGGSSSAGGSAAACGAVTSGSADASTKAIVGCVYWVDSTRFHTCDIPTCPFTDRLKARLTVIAGQPHGAVNIVCACDQVDPPNGVQVDAPGASGLVVVTLSYPGTAATSKLYLSIIGPGGSGSLVDEIRYPCQTGGGTSSVYDPPGTC